MEPGAIHPLLIPHVMEEIFKSQNLTKQDLLSLRSVCQDWRHVATEAYRDQDATTFLLDRNNFPTKEKINSVLNLAQDPHANLPLPGKMVLHAEFFRKRETQLPLFHQKADRMLRIMAPNLRELNLLTSCLASYMWNEQFPLPPFNSLIDFPQLRTFELTIPTENPLLQDLTSLSTYFYQLSQSVLTSSPRLEEVNITVFDPYRHKSRYPRNYDELLRNIPVTIEKMKIHIGWNRSAAIIMAEMNLPNLKSLYLGNFTNLTFEDFHRMLLGVKDTLIELTLKDGYAGGIKFPVFPILKTLNLKLGLRPNFSRRRIQDFSTVFPQVEELNMDELGSRNEFLLSGLFPPGFSAPQVKSLTFPEVQISNHHMPNFAFGFSNLKKLVISPGHWCPQWSPLPIVFRYMTTLEELVLYCSRSNEVKIPPLAWIDPILTGIGRVQCGRILRKGNYDAVNLEDVKKFPGISDMKKLKSLRIELSPKFCLSDVTGYLGILKMENLTELSMDSLHMTSACSERLELRFGKGSIQNPQLDRGKELKPRVGKHAGSTNTP